MPEIKGKTVNMDSPTDLPSPRLSRIFMPRRISKDSSTSEAMKRMSLDPSKMMMAPSQSPAAPTTIGPSRQDSRPNSIVGGFSKVKLYYGSDIFVIAIPSNLSTLTELTSKIERKLRLCGVVVPADRPLRLRYKDEDGDLIQIYGDDDILLALDATRGSEAERGIVHIYVE
jgi:hypothetical protein